MIRVYSGMMVAGHLHAEGSSLSEGKRITLGLQERSSRSNVSLAPVRLVGGRTELEGRLQVGSDSVSLHCDIPVYFH